jgi:outer membrane protein assembly factor BamB
MARLLLASLLGLAGCQSIRLDAPVRPRSGDWTTTGASMAHNTRLDAAIRPPLERAWEYNAEAAFGPGGTVVVAGVLLVGTLRGELHAVSLEKGKRIGVVKFKEPIEGTPVLGGGRLFLATSWGDRTVHAYDLERGGKRWSAKAEPVEAGMLLVDGVLVVATTDGEVTGRDPGTGTVLWAAPSAGGPASSTPVSTDGRAVVVADQGGLVRAIRAADGRELWSADAGAPVYAALTAVGDGIVVPTTRGRVLGLEAGTGRTRWQYGAADSTVRFAPAAGDPSRIVFGATDGQVRAVDPETGELLWTAVLPDGIDAQPLLAGDVVWVGTMGRELSALDAGDGSVLWTTELPGRSRSSLTAHDGGLIVLSEPRTIIFMKPGEVEHED